MAKFTLRVKLENEPAYRRIRYEAPDMETAVKCGYDHAKQHYPNSVFVDFQVISRE